MAVSKKGKRKVNYKGRPFIWSVAEKETQVPTEGGFVDPNPARYLHIIATNKKFMVHYKIPNEGDEYADLRVEGAQFPRQPATAPSPPSSKPPSPSKQTATSNYSPITTTPSIGSTKTSPN